MAGVAGIGLGSGLNIADMVNATVAAERAPKAVQLERMEKSASAKISSLGTLKGAIGEFEDALKALKEDKLFNQRKASVSKSDSLAVNVQSSAKAGKYQVEVSQLARSSKLAGGSVKGGAEAQFAEGGIVVVALGDTSFEVEVKAGSTLGELQEQINSELNKEGIRANLLKDPHSGESRLVLTADKSGEGNDLKLSVISNDENLKALAENQQVLETAANAKFKIDGLELQSASNEVKDVMQGVTLNLKAVSDKAIEVKIDSNQGEVKSKLHQFVEAYNKLHATCKELGHVVAVKGGEPLVGQLTGDSSLRSLQNNLSKTLGSAMPGEMRLLSDLGISSSKEGKLSIDDKKLDKALADNYQGATQFLSGENGLMERLSASVSAYSKKGGILDARMDSEQKTRDSVKAQEAALDLRMASVEKNLYAKFLAMDRLVGQLSKTSERLNSLLAGLPGVGKKKD